MLAGLPPVFQPDDPPISETFSLTSPPSYVLISFVSDAPTFAVLASCPGPHQDRSVPTRRVGPVVIPAAPGRIGSLLGLVRKLIVFGKNRACALRQRPAIPDCVRATANFGTRDIALILARIARGLLLAAALEARLVPRAAREAAQPDAPQAPEPAPACVPGQAAADAPPRAEPVCEPSSRKSPAATSPTVRRADNVTALLARMPTPDEIAALVRRRPIGAVLADICSDLGIVASHPLWRELKNAVTDNGGSFLRLMRDLFKRCSILNFVPPGTPMIPPMPPGWQPPPHVSFAEALGTGPP